MWADRLATDMTKLSIRFSQICALAYEKFTIVLFIFDTDVKLGLSP
jgi:hypothetical protein